MGSNAISHAFLVQDHAIGVAGRCEIRIVRFYPKEKHGPPKFLQQVRKVFSSIHRSFKWYVVIRTKSLLNCIPSELYELTFVDSHRITNIKLQIAFKVVSFSDTFDYACDTLMRDFTRPLRS